MIECRKKVKSKVSGALNDEEVRVKMKYFENLISELEWMRTPIVKPDGEDERSQIYRDTENEIKKISAQFLKKERLLVKDTNVFQSRMAVAAKLKLLQEKDNSITDVVLAVHHRLGRVDLSAHKKAYRRILYALIVQGLCRLMEHNIVLAFRESDMKIGEAVVPKAQQKYNRITGMSVHISVSQDRFLPIETCGGVYIFSANGRRIVNNSLAIRLDQLLQKACPMVRIALYGPNENRIFFDLSKMSGSPTLFGFASKLDLHVKEKFFSGNGQIPAEI